MLSFVTTKTQRRGDPIPVLSSILLETTHAICVLSGRTLKAKASPQPPKVCRSPCDSLRIYIYICLYIYIYIYLQATECAGLGVWTALNRRQLLNQGANSNYSKVRRTPDPKPLCRLQFYLVSSVDLEPLPTNQNPHSRPIRCTSRLLNLAQWGLGFRLYQTWS